MQVRSKALAQAVQAHLLHAVAATASPQQSVSGMAEARLLSMRSDQCTKARDKEVHQALAIRKQEPELRGSKGPIRQDTEKNE